MATQPINSDTVDIPSVNFAQQGSDPAAPAAGRWQLFFKAGGLYARSNAGGVIGPFLTTTAATLTIAEIDGVPSGLPTTLQFPNGTLSDQGAGVYRYTPAAAEGGDYTQLAEVVVGGGGAASIDLPNIPATYRSLVLEIYGRCDRAAQNFDQLAMRFNADANNNYDYLVSGHYTTSHVSLSGQAAAFALVSYIPGAAAPANRAASVRIIIPRYADTTFDHLYYLLGMEIHGTTGTNVIGQFGGGNWRSTAAINQITLTTENGANFLGGSVATLYGIS